LCYNLIIYGVCRNEKGDKRMKKIIGLALAILLTVAMLSGCSKKNNTTGTQATTTEAPKPTGYEIALITDKGNIDDKSFNQGAWEGVVKFAEENNITHKYYKPEEASDAGYLAAIDLAVQGGAKTIVTPGFLFEVPVYTAQTKYPDVKFVLLDGAPHTADYATFKTEANVASVMYAEEQSGYLAGYAAVQDGMTKLGFMGGMAVPAVQAFGYGYLQGAEAAAAITLLPTEPPHAKITSVPSWYIVFAVALFVSFSSKFPDDRDVIGDWSGSLADTEKTTRSPSAAETPFGAPTIGE
jgi:basic membrane protein A